MGGAQIKYATFVGPEVEGETRALRHHAIGDKALRKYPDMKCSTLYGMWKNTVTRVPNNKFLGTRAYLGETESTDDKGVVKKTKNYDNFTWKTIK